MSRTVNFLLEARACVADALEAQKQDHPLIDEQRIVGRLVSVLRSIDAVLALPEEGDGRHRNDGIPADIMNSRPKSFGGGSGEMPGLPRIESLSP